MCDTCGEAYLEEEVWNRCFEKRMRPLREGQRRHRPAYEAATRLGPTFYDLDYDASGPDASGCVPLLTLLPNALDA